MKRFVLFVGCLLFSVGCALESTGEDSSMGSDSGCMDCSDAGSDSGSDAAPKPECMSASDCSDGEWCNGQERCLDGVCEDGTAPNCDDGVGCTYDSCSDTTAGCVHVADNAICAGGGECSPSAGGCVYSEACNGLDDDLDGETDEGLTSPCETSCGAGEMLCVGGVFDLDTCSAPAPVPESCDGVDSDCDGLIDEGCTAPCSGTNLVMNHSFEDTLDGWLNEVHPGASAVFLPDCSHATDGACSATVKTTMAASYYDVQLKQVGVSTSAGTLYQLCLMLAAEAPRDVVLEYLEDDEPWASGGLWEMVSIDEYWREVCFSFTATDISPARLTLEVGASTEKVWVDDVRLRSCP